MEEIRYTIEEMKAFLSRMSEQYDVARLVNASECYTIGLGNQGSISYEKNCYCVWERDGRCKNCSSYRAHITGVQQEKTESFHGKLYHILSIPATLLLRDGSPCACVIELITIGGGEKDTVSPKRKVLEKLVPMNIQVAPVLEKDLLTGMYSKEEFFRKVRQLLQE